MIKATGLIVVSFRRAGMPAPLVVLNRFMKLDIVSKTPSQGKTKFFVSRSQIKLPLDELTKRGL
jgi:hypothetical protein